MPPAMPPTMMPFSPQAQWGGYPPTMQMPPPHVMQPPAPYPHYGGPYHEYGWPPMGGEFAPRDYERRGEYSPPEYRDEEYEERQMAEAIRQSRDSRYHGRTDDGAGPSYSRGHAQPTAPAAMSAPAPGRAETGSGRPRPQAAQRQENHYPQNIPDDVAEIERYLGLAEVEGAHPHLVFKMKQWAKEANSRKLVDRTPAQALLQRKWKTPAWFDEMRGIQPRAAGSGGRIAPPQPGDGPDEYVRWLNYSTKNFIRGVARGRDSMVDRRTVVAHIHFKKIIPDSLGAKGDRDPITAVFAEALSRPDDILAAIHARRGGAAPAFNPEAYGGPIPPTIEDVVEYLAAHGFTDEDIRGVFAPWATTWINYPRVIRAGPVTRPPEPTPPGTPTTGGTVTPRHVTPALSEMDTDVTGPGPSDSTVAEASTTTMDIDLNHGSAPGAPVPHSEASASMDNPDGSASGAPVSSS